MLGRDSLHRRGRGVSTVQTPLKARRKEDVLQCLYSHDGSLYRTNPLPVATQRS